MRSLFLKIFLSFWIAQALFIVLAILTTIAMRPQREYASWEALQSKVLREAIQANEKEGAEGVHRYLNDLEQSQHVQAFLFDDKGQEVSGARPPAWVERVYREGPRPLRGLARLSMRPRVLRDSMLAADGRRYTMVLMLPPGPGVLFGPRGIPGLGIFIAVISSGLVCFFLARYLTKPIVRLRAATQRIAAGDLTARAGASGRRRDEISELVRDFDTMAERLEALVKAQSRLLNDISHELRSPLARLNVALALARQRSGAEAQGALDRIEIEADRLNELIGRLLTIARLESREAAMRTSSFSLNELIADVAKDADFEAQSRNCRVSASMPSDCVLVGSPGLLHSAIENVVRNAVRYTKVGTEVEISLHCAGSEAIVRVTDSGPGVPEESLGKLFEPFYRIDDSRGRQTGGVGLGLAIAKRAVGLHGGTVTAANRPGGGFAVEIHLPLTQREPASETPELVPA